MPDKLGLTGQSNLSGGSGIIGSIPEATGTFSYDETNAAEQDVLTITPATRSLIGSIWVDMVNVTQNTTIRLYHAIDGTNRRLFQESPWLVADNDGVLLDGFTIRGSLLLSLQCGGGGAGAVNVPYAVV